MSRKLILFAQKAEAAATIDHFKAKPLPGITTYVWSEGEIPSCYTFDGGLIVLMGMGMAAALHATARYIEKVDEVINLGLTGALKEGLAIGELTQINVVAKYTPLPPTLDETSQNCTETLLPPIDLDKRGLSLLTSDFPIHDLSLKSKLSQDWDLVDMEGYGVAYAAQAAKKKCTLIKIVSDFASPKGRELIRQHKQKLSTQLAEFLSAKR